MSVFREKMYLYNIPRLRSIGFSFTSLSRVGVVMSRSSLQSATFTTLAFSLLGLLLTIGLSGCGGKADDGWPKDHAGPKVVVSFAPYYCFAVNVAGDDAVVRTLMTTSGPHEFEPTDKDARLLRRADLFFINGLGLEGEKPETLKRGSGNPKLKIVDLGSLVPQDKLLEGSCHHDHKDGDDDHDHGKDPHIWLSPDHVEILVNGIRDELKAADPAHAANYDRRAKEYIEKLKKLKTEGIAILKDKKDRKMVSFHDSLTYFAKAFDLNIAGVVEKNPGTEPNDQELKKLIALCADEDHPIRLITVEPQYGTSNSGEELIKTLKHKKVPDPVLVEIDTLETVVPDQLNAGWYEAKMLANLKALAEKMK
jgi:zinc transport system substrate-binding protein